MAPQRAQEVLRDRRGALHSAAAGDAEASAIPIEQNAGFLSNTANEYARGYPIRMAGAEDFLPEEAWHCFARREVTHPIEDAIS